MTTVDQKDKDKQNAEISQQIKTTTRTNLFQRLAARFGFGVRKPTAKSQSSFKLIQTPTSAQFVQKNTTSEIEMIDKIFRGSTLSSTVQDLFEDWAKDTQNTYRNIYERETRLDALTFLCDNEGVVNHSVNLVAAEVASLTDNVAFTVISEDEAWQENTNILLKKVWHYDQPTIYTLAWDIFLYGEAFQAREISSAGVVDISNIKVNDIVERCEFKPAEVLNFHAQANAFNGAARSTGFTVNLMNPTNGGFTQNNLNFTAGSRQTTYKSTDSLLKDYIKNLSDVCENEWFTSHLLGYRIANDTLIAPWQIVHYRMNSHTNEFWPYGRSQLLDCLSAWKQLQRTMGLDDLATLLNMPVHMYKVNTKGATPARAFDIVNTVKEEFENVGLMSHSAGIEGPSLCTTVWTSDDLLTVEKSKGEGTTDNSNTDKMKFFYERLANATGIPMSYLCPGTEGFQMSGVALAALYRPFRTLVSNIRGIISSEVEDTIRLHDSINNVETPDFVLTMNVENPVASDDLSQKLTLVDSVLDQVTNLLGLEDKSQLPQSVKKDIISKYGGLSVTELAKYIQVLEQDGVEEELEVSDEELEAGFGDELDDDSDTDMEESYRNKKRRLIEARYRSTKKDKIKYHLVEKLGTLQLPKSSSHFCSGCNSKLNEDYIKFLVSRPRVRKGRKRIIN